MNSIGSQHWPLMENSWLLTLQNWAWIQLRKLHRVSKWDPKKGSEQQDALLLHHCIHLPISNGQIITQDPSVHLTSKEQACPRWSLHVESLNWQFIHYWLGDGCSDAVEEHPAVLSLSLRLILKLLCSLLDPIHAQLCKVSSQELPINGQCWDPMELTCFDLKFL